MSRRVEDSPSHVDSLLSAKGATTRAATRRRERTQLCLTRKFCIAALIFFFSFGGSFSSLRRPPEVGQLWIILVSFSFTTSVDGKDQKIKHNIVSAMISFDVRRGCFVERVF